MPTTKKTQTTARKTVMKAPARKSRGTTMQATPMATQVDTASASLQPDTLQKKIRAVLLVALLFSVIYYFRDLFIVAIVNGQPVTRFEVIRDLEKQAGKGAASALVSKKLIAMEADKKGISVDQKDIDARITAIEKDLKSSGQTLDEVLKLQGVTRKEVEEQTRLQLMLKKLLKDKIAVKDADVDAAVKEQAESKPKDMSDAEFKEQVRTSLEEQQFSFEAQSYIQELQNNAKITYWHQY